MERITPFMDEKRRFQRVNILGIKASYKLLDPRTWSTYHEKIQEPIQNISIGGIALNTSYELAIKAPVGVDIKINPDTGPIRTFGRVAWIRKEPGKNKYQMGISFSWWKKEEDKKTVYELIQKNIR